MPLEISWRWKWEIQKVEMRNTSRKSWENEMRIGRVTKWGLGGWHECPATAALGEVWKFTLVSEHAEIRMNSKSTHSAPSIAKWLSWKPSKSNLPVLRVLETQPTSSSKWVGEPDYLVPNSKSRLPLHNSFRLWVHNRSEGGRRLGLHLR